jgi:two-component system sensor histidine kinase UhpB
MGQALTAISMNLAAITAGLAQSGPPDLKERAVEAKLLTEQTLEQIREMSLNLRPPMLDDLGLIPTLRWHIKRYAKRTEIITELEVAGVDERLASPVETALYRIIQEALTNVARHAQAHQVFVRLERTGDVVQATIRDDGQGFDLAAVLKRPLPDHGVGLLGIRERVTLLGGEFDIQTGPGEGTRLSIVIPRVK